MITKYKRTGVNMADRMYGDSYDKKGNLHIYNMYKSREGKEGGFSKSYVGSGAKRGRRGRDHYILIRVV